MYQLSCDISRFASKSLEEGLSVADTLRINHIELADFGGKPLEQCSGSEVEDIRCALIDTNKTIVLLSTALSATCTRANLRDSLRLFSRIRSSTTMVLLIEYPTMVRQAAINSALLIGCESEETT